jgi:hypothetical protein
MLAKGSVVSIPPAFAMVTYNGNLQAQQQLSSTTKNLVRQIRSSNIWNPTPTYSVIYLCYAVDVSVDVSVLGQAVDIVDFDGLVMHFLAAACIKPPQRQNHDRRALHHRLHILRLASTGGIPTAPPDARISFLANEGALVTGHQDGFPELVQCVL